MVTVKIVIFSGKMWKEMGVSCQREKNLADSASQPGKEGGAKKKFGGRVVITTDGKRHLGAQLETKSFRDEY